MSFLLPLQQEMNLFLSLIMTLCDCLYFVGLYTAVIKMITGVVAFYDNLKADLQPVQEITEEIYLLEE